MAHCAETDFLIDKNKSPAGLSFQAHMAYAVKQAVLLIYKVPRGFT